MASLSIGTNLSPSHHFKTRSFCSVSSHSPVQTQSLSSSKPCFGLSSSLRGMRTPRLLGSVLLARAEDKAKSSSIQEQFQVVLCALNRSFQFLRTTHYLYFGAHRSCCLFFLFCFWAKYESIGTGYIVEGSKSSFQFISDLNIFGIALAERAFGFA